MAWKRSKSSHETTQKARATILNGSIFFESMSLLPGIVSGDCAPCACMHGAGEDRSDPILFAQVSGPARAQCLGLLLVVVMVLRVASHVASGGNCSCASVCFVTDNYCLY